MKEFTEQEMVRRNKLQDIEKFCNPYPDHFDRTHKLIVARELEDGTTGVKIAGRIVFLRKMGKLSFVRIRDLESDMQLEIKVDILGEENYEFFKKQIDTGDFVGAEGEIFTTQTGEKTLRVENFEFLGKSLRPLPEKFHGLTDIEERYRRRYVDLIMNDESKNIAFKRPLILKEKNTKIDFIAILGVCVGMLLFFAENIFGVSDSKFSDTKFSFKE